MSRASHYPGMSCAIAGPAHCTTTLCGTRSVRTNACPAAPCRAPRKIYLNNEHSRSFDIAPGPWTEPITSCCTYVRKENGPALLASDYACTPGPTFVHDRRERSPISHSGLHRRRYFGSWCFHVVARQVCSQSNLNRCPQTQVLTIDCTPPAQCVIQMHCSAG